MAEKKVANFTIDLNVEGLEDLTGLTRSLRQLDKAFKPLNDVGLKNLNKNIATTIAQVPKTINQFKQKERTLKALRNETDLTSKEFKDLGDAIQSNAAKLKAFTQIQPKGIFGKLKASKFGVGGRAALGSMAGSMAGQLGSTGQLGLAGAALGGPVGAVAGATLGGVIDTVKAASSAAKYSAQIQKLEVALKGVTKTQSEFNKAQKIISDTSRRLNVPLGAATKQFTTLSASVIGAGGNVDDAEKVFKGVSEAIKATGGDAEDVQSAIRAMSQIFGKGKVSAEELQGQLGERLPGAVVKFANATGRTLPELQKDLRDGTVGLNDVMKFVVKLSEDHADAAEKMANSQADAGQKMSVALRELQKEFGDLFVPVGAMIQRFIASMANALTAVIKFFRGVKKENNEMAAQEFALELVGGKDALTDFGKRRLSKGAKFDVSMLKTDKRGEFEFIRDKRLDFLNKEDKEGTPESKFDDPTSPIEKKLELAKIKQELGLINEQEVKNLEIEIKSAEIFKQIGGEANDLGLTLESIQEKLKKGKDEAFNFKEAFTKISDEATNLDKKVGELAIATIDKLGDAFADFFTTGKMGFADLARSAIQELNRIIIKAAFMRFIANPITDALGLTGNANGNVISGGEVVPSAMGNVFAKNKIVPYKMGGIVDRPTIFPMKNGMGLMGEAGPESVMPLKRGRDGKLGVIATGGGVGNISVNVDASGSTVEGDTNQASELGKMLGMAVQAELIKQKRPGGLLS